MERANLLQLQNGSDVRGIALTGMKGENINLTPDAVKNIAASYVLWMAEKCNKPTGELIIGVGHDSRLSADSLKNGVIDGLLLAGCQVMDCGLCSTPSMFMGIVFKETNFDGSIMITASHLPFNRNGLKFFSQSGGLNSTDIKEILLKAENLTLPERSNDRQANKLNLIDFYSRFLRDKIKQEVVSEDYDHPLKGLKIVVDAGNGSGGFFVEQVLKPLGADTEGSQFLNPDGNFPNHIPNPENEAAMESIQKATLDSKADLGIIFDTDVDRAAVVFANGEEVNRNRLIGLTAAILSKYHPHTTIVTDSVTSDHLTEFVENTLDMKHRRFKRGYKNVINEAIRLNREGVETHIAIETSGHCAFKENYFQDDGAYLVVKVLIEAAICRNQGRTIETLIKDLKEPKESKEFRMKITAEDYKTYGVNLLKSFEEYAAKQPGFYPVANNYEGIRVSIRDKKVTGWMLLRVSLHDPLMPMNIEADTKDGVNVITNRLMPFLEKQKQLDITSLK
ncbi:MAG: phosphomannomutase/phosphoglucomutase [Lachnospiraceae bacterium]|jgi:phosphomannomutase|nr:phosphomannomutase/phosphoglucomutase [Lachnospiraceae bacterium]